MTVIIEKPDFYIKVNALLVSNLLRATQFTYSKAVNVDWFPDFYKLILCIWQQINGLFIIYDIFVLKELNEKFSREVQKIYIKRDYVEWVLYLSQKKSEICIQFEYPVFQLN